MSDGIWVKYTELSQVNDKLIDIVKELDNAPSRGHDLNDAIGKPMGRDELRSATSNFENRWDDRRKDLSRDIKKVQEHVQGVLDGLTEWDASTAAQFEGDVDVSGAQNSGSGGGGV